MVDVIQSQRITKTNQANHAKKSKYEPSLSDDQEIMEKELKEFLAKTRMSLCESLGKGGFGDVFLAILDGRKYALKRIFVPPTDPHRVKKFELAKGEIIITSNLRCKNCIRFFGAYEFPNSKFIILERAVNKDLSFITHTFYSLKLFTSLHMNQELLQSSEKQNLPSLKWYRFMSESLVQFFFLQLLNALDYLRQMNFVHRDIKLENMLLTSTFQIKLADFYLATEVKRKENFKLSSSGSTAYMAPEIFSGKTELNPGDAFKLDYYSAGAVLIKMLLNVYIWPKDKAIDYLGLLKEINKAQSDEYYTPREKTTPEAKKLISQLIDPDVSKRPGINEIKSNAWVTQNNERLQFLHDVNESDPVKFLLEVQKCDFIERLHDRKQFSKGYTSQKIKFRPPDNEYRYKNDSKNNFHSQLITKSKNALTYKAQSSRK